MRDRRCPSETTGPGTAALAPRIRARALAAGLVALAAPGVAQAAEELVLIPDLPMLVFLVVFFLALIVPVNALIFKPIFRALDERESRMVGARKRAEQIDAEADAVLARYQASIAEARAAAETARKQLVESARSEQASVAKAARSEAESLVERARAELGEALDQARSSLRASSEELGRLAAERILGRSL